MKLRLLLLALGTAILASCAGTGAGTQSYSPQDLAQIEARKIAIANEPNGNWYIGRRYHIPRTQFWGYLRRPGQSWDQSRLVIFNEHQELQADRLPEDGTGGRALGYDHNYEYVIHGSFTGDTVYDPNSNLFLPEFRLHQQRLINAQPGYLFKPNERSTQDRLLRHEPGPHN